MYQGYRGEQNKICPPMPIEEDIYKENKYAGIICE